MNRRDFLRSIVAFGSAASIPVFLFTEIDDGEFLGTEHDYSHFNPIFSYGNEVLIYGEQDLRIALRILDENIIYTIPKHYRSMVEFRFNPPGASGTADFFDEVGLLSWKYSPNNNHLGYVASKAGIESING